MEIIMKDIPDIDNLNKEQLEKLKKKIEQKLYGFWDAIKMIGHYREECVVVEEHFKEKEKHVIEKSAVLKKLYAYGWTVVFHENNRVSIIDYNKPKKDAQFYGCEFDRDKNAITFNGMRKPSDKDVEFLKNVLEEVC